VIAYQLEFVSDFWVNLHHVLYAAAWAGRTGPRSMAGALPAPLHCPDEQWLAAIDCYDRNIADRHLLFDPEMHDLGLALIDGEPTDILRSVAPIYQQHFWAAHDRANHAWISDATTRMETLAPAVIPVLEKAFDEPWPTAPVRVDVVWVGTREGAYTSSHITISSGDPDWQQWSAAEAVFHETSHLMMDTLLREFQEYGPLWHVVLFYVVGEAVRRALHEPYTPYAYAIGLFDRAWPQYRSVVEECWTPFLDGEIDGAAAIARTRSRSRSPQ
jgi:hypothetical protein